MHERLAKKLAIFYAMVVLGGFIYVGQSYLEMRAEYLARLAAERSRTEQVKKPEKPIEERLVAPAPIVYPFY